MFLLQGLAAFALLLLTSFQLVAAVEQGVPTDEQRNGFKAMILAKVNYFRGLESASAVTWDDTLALLSEAQAQNCTLQYDIFNDGDRGQMVFNLGNEDGTWPDIVNGSWLATEYWWDERKMYHPRSDEYDDLSEFRDSWEFTQMIWKASTKIGCGWSYSLCDYPADAPQMDGHTFKNTAQFVCNMTPAGNQLYKFAANVACNSGCKGIQPQTTTIDVSTISITQRAVAAAASTATPSAFSPSPEIIAALQAEVERVEAYRYLSPEEFIPGFISDVQNQGKVMAEAGHKGMLEAGYDSEYFKRADSAR